MSGYTRSHINWLVDNTNTPVGVVGRDGREWQFPASLAAGSDGGARMVEGRVLFDSTDTPIGFYVNGREFIFSSPFTLNTTRGYRMNHFALLVNAAGVPCGLRAGFATAPMLFASLPVENGSSSPLLFASPNNAVANNAGLAASGTQLHTLARGVHTLAFDCSELRFLDISFNLSAASIALHANQYTIQGRVLEKGDASANALARYGGSQTKVVNPGDTRVLSDAILPSQFGLGVFAAGSKWFGRQQDSVTAAGLILPVGVVPYVNAGFSANVGITMDPVAYPAGGGSLVTGLGPFALGGGGWTSLPSPPKSMLIGRPVGAPPGVWAFIGNSIVEGAGDAQVTAGSASVLGMCSRACWQGDGVAGAIGCVNMGSSGAVGSIWQGANGALARELWAFCNRGFDDFGTNRFQPTASSDAAERVAALQNWADMRAAGIQKILRTTLLPRTTSTDSWATTGANQTPINSSWDPAGTHEVYDFNAWIRSQQNVGNGPDAIVELLGARSSSTVSAANFLIWLAASTTEGIHPNTARHIALASGEVRPALLTYP